MMVKAGQRRSDRDRDINLSSPEEIGSRFWQEWLEHQDSLYQCCLKLMNSNPTDAEDALSRAMLKAWEKVQPTVLSGTIPNFKGWLMRLTSNLCIDIIRERSRGASGVESIEEVAAGESIGTGTPVLTPECALEREEKDTQIRRAIGSLAERLRSTFILHYYQELTHTEIAEIQGISYDNVCKRISQARKILTFSLIGYFLAEEGEAGPNRRAPEEPTPPTQGKKQSIQSVDEPKGISTATGKCADECVQKVARVGEKPLNGEMEQWEIERKKISEQANVSGDQPVEWRRPVSLPTSTKHEKYTEKVEADARKAEATRDGKLEVVTVVGEIEPWEMEREKISQQAHGSSGQPVYEGRPVQWPATTEKLTTIVGAHADWQQGKGQTNREEDPEKMVGSTVRLSVAGEEVESVMGWSPPEVAGSVQHYVSATAAGTTDGKLEVVTVVGEIELWKREREKISQQANGSGGQPVYDGRQAKWQVTSLAEKLTTIVGARADLPERKGWKNREEDRFTAGYRDGPYSRDYGTY